MRRLIALVVLLVGCSAAPPRTATAVHPLRRIAEPVATAYRERGDGTLEHLEVACALDDEGAWSCRFGDGPWRRVEGVSPATQLVAGHRFVCALEHGGTIACLRTEDTKSKPSAVTLPFRAKNIAANELALVVQGEDGRVHECTFPFDTDAPHTECELTELAVADVDAYVNTNLQQCSLDTTGHASCRGRFSDNDDEEHRIAVPGFPRRVRRLAEGLGAYETGAVVCAIGEAGDLACHRGGSVGTGSELVADVRRIPLPRPVRDIAFDDAYARLLLDDGSVWAMPVSVTRRYPEGAQLFVPAKLALPERVTALGARTCVRYESGRIACHAPR